MYVREPNPGAGAPLPAPTRGSWGATVYVYTFRCTFKSPSCLFVPALGERTCSNV